MTARSLFAGALGAVTVLCLQKQQVRQVQRTDAGQRSAGAWLAEECEVLLVRANKHVVYCCRFVAPAVSSGTQNRQPEACAVAVNAGAASVEENSSGTAA